MKTNIYVPDRINVGYQNRKDTYTGKLAYVIYFDQKGKLRKETSWQSWRDEKLGNDIFTNEPTEGFVINKKTGGIEESWGWDVRKTYARVYDPRGFEFEITIPNLLWILECCNCIKGKGLEGQFVYGWDGKELVLVPVDSPDYKAIQEKTRVVVENTFVKPSELVIGYTYEKLDGSQYVYMGKAQYWIKEYNHQQYTYNLLTHKNVYINRYAKPVDDTWKRNPSNPYDNNKLVRFVPTEVRYWFVKVGKTEDGAPWESIDCVDCWKSANRKFAKCVSTDTSRYNQCLKKLNSTISYSPIDFEKSRIVQMTFEQFQKALTKCYPDLYHIEDGQLQYVPIYRSGHKWIASRISNGYSAEHDDLFKFYQEIKPAYGEEYCISGELYRRYGHEE